MLSNMYVCMCTCVHMCVCMYLIVCTVSLPIESTYSLSHPQVPFAVFSNVGWTQVFRAPWVLDIDILVTLPRTEYAAGGSLKFGTHCHSVFRSSWPFTGPSKAHVPFAPSLPTLFPREPRCQPESLSVGEWVRKMQQDSALTQRAPHPSLVEQGGVWRAPRSVGKLGKMKPSSHLRSVEKASSQRQRVD